MKRLGILAGSGDLPLSIYNKEPDAYVVGIKGFCNPERWAKDFSTYDIFECQEIIDCLKLANVTRIIMVGNVDSPSFDKSDIKKTRAAEILLRLQNNNGGDDKVLRQIIEFLAEEGFEVVGVDDILGYQVIEKAVLTTAQPSKIAMSDIEYGKYVLETQSKLDIGQSVAIQAKIVLAVEAVEGTDCMIERAGSLKKAGEKPTLVKMIKTTQTRKSDLPTVGINTLDNLHKNGFSGVALSSDGIIIIDKKSFIDYANKLNLFVIGI